MTIPNRSASSSNYRYGFNGMEKDDELKGIGNSYNYGARMLDPRIGRFFAVYALSRKYPNLSPYAYSANNPILFKDIDGNDFIVVIDHKNQTITIKQINFYANEEDKIADQGAVDQLNSFKAVYKNKDGLSYDVSFDVTQEVVVKKDATTTRQDVINKTKNTIAGNAVFFVDDTDFNAIYTGTEDVRMMAGVTESGKTTYNRKSIANTNTAAHERGHLFGLEDKEGAIGTMAYLKYDSESGEKEKLIGDIGKLKKHYEKQSPVTKGNIKSVINNVLKLIKDFEAGKYDKTVFDKPLPSKSGTIKVDKTTIIEIKGEYKGDKTLTKKGVTGGTTVEKK